MPKFLFGNHSKVEGKEFYEVEEDLTESHFKIREGCRVTLFQDAHCEGSGLKGIVTDSGGLDMGYTAGNCFEQIYEAILNAKRMIYITGWSVDTKISLLRKRPIFHEEYPREEQKDGKMTMGELLIWKADQGVKVLLNVWDEALSVNIGLFKTAGVMGTFDEETKAFFAKTNVTCKLSYRTGVTKDNQFLWTHHQKSVVVDAEPSSDSTYDAVEHLKNCSYMQGLYQSNLGEESANLAQSLALTEDHYGAPDRDGHRYAISSFMTCEHNFTKLWDDKGTRCQPNSISIFRPNPPEGWYILGDFAERGAKSRPSNLTKVFVVKEPLRIEGQDPVLAPPESYEEIWEPKWRQKLVFASANSVKFWRPIPPQHYHALGFVVTIDGKKPSTDLIRCVHTSALEAAHPKFEEDTNPLWKNKGVIKASIGGPEMSIWNLSPTRTGIICGTFVVRTGFKLPSKIPESTEYWCMADPPCGVDVCPKPDEENYSRNSKQKEVLTKHTNVSIDLGGKCRRIIAFVGGLDLTNGRWDTPNHTLFSSLNDEHKNDFLHGWGIRQEFGPREPWHDIHAKFEGPIARDVLTNFEQRWRKQGKKGVPLLHIGSEFINVKEEEILNEESWNCRLARSIDPFSADITYKDNSIQRCYVDAIRKAKRFIYIENQYFMGGAKYWLRDNDVKCTNWIPFEIAKRVASSIEDYVPVPAYAPQIDLPVVAYILLPMYPEGLPIDAAIQEQLAWQWNTMEMMYSIVHNAMVKKGLNGSPMNYLKFLCVGAREEGVSDKKPPAKSNELKLWTTRRVPIYVHSKLMIIDDEYCILGSANINERSMAGDRDSELCVESWQPAFTDVASPRGGVHQFRMSLWSEHLGESLPAFLNPNSVACSNLISEKAAANWKTFVDDEVKNMPSHLMRYPLNVADDGKITPSVTYFPDTTAKVKGTASATMPDFLTC